MTAAALAELGSAVAALRAAVVIALPDGVVAGSWARSGADQVGPAAIADLTRMVTRQRDLIGHMSGERSPARLVVANSDVRLLVEPLDERSVVALVFEPSFPEALAVLHARRMVDGWSSDSTGVPRRSPSRVASALERLMREAADPELAALRVALRARIRPGALLVPDELDERAASLVCEQIDIVLGQPMPGLQPHGGR